MEGNYQIHPFTHARAHHHRLVIFPSDNPKWKLEVYTEKGAFITYCGNRKLLDFPTYLEERGLFVACRKRYQWFNRRGCNIGLEIPRITTGEALGFKYNVEQWATSILLW